MRRLITGLGVVLLLVSACSSGDDDSAGTTEDSFEETGAPIGDDGDADTAGTTTDGTTTGGGASTAAPTDLSTDPSSGRDAASEGSGLDDPAEPEQTVGLQAGSVDDNETWEDYLRYRESFAGLGIAVDDLPVDGRRVLTITDDDGVAVHDAEIVVTGGGDPVTLRTGSDGRAVYLAPVAGIDDQQSATELVATVRHGEVETSATIGAEQLQTIVLDGAGASGVVQLDVLFLVDATGSMDDEIERLKANMAGVAEKIGRSESSPDVRFALTSYRDDTDDYVARTVDFTSDISSFVTSLRGLSADGGGDYPEALNEAFAESIGAPSWRLDDDVVRLVFLIADAPPHIGRGTSYVDSIGGAAAKGIRVFPIASSGTDDQAEFVFRQMAQATLGRFVFLSYGADGAGAAVGPGSNIEPGSYDVLALDELVVRLVEEQLAPLADR